MRRSALLTASLLAMLTTTAHAGPMLQREMTAMPSATQPVGLRRCPLGAVQCMGGFVQRCVERWGDTMWMTNGQRCSR